MPTPTMTLSEFNHLREDWKSKNPNFPALWTRLSYPQSSDPTPGPWMLSFSTEFPRAQVEVQSFNDPFSPGDLIVSFRGPVQRVLLVEG